MGIKTKIESFDSTWNPVTGCLHSCEYCYARGIANRFAQSVEDCINENVDLFTQEWLPLYEEFIFRFHHQPWKVTANRKRTKSPYPCGFAPTFHEYRLDEPQRWKKPRTIFVGSMCDLFGKWVPDEWIREVFAACDKAQQHRYMFLTKNPSRYKDLVNLLPVHRRPPNVAEMWFGHSYTGIGDYRPISLPSVYSRFISIEPLLHSLSEQDMMVVAATNDWIIIGAETGNRKGKVTPDKRWVNGIVYYAYRYNVPVFMKESLRGIMGDDFRQEFPWEV